MFSLSIISVVILALIQGLTEFLPVSSSGHLILVPKLLQLENFGLAFDAFLHLGTLFAVLIYFRKDVLNLAKGFFLFDKSYSKQSWGIFFASIPVVLVGFGFKGLFESEYIRSIDFVAYTLIAGSILMYLAEKFSKAENSIEKLNLKQMFFVGLLQCLALYPGMSRSGSTIAGGLFTGLKKEEAARFSFLLGLPAIAGAGLLAVKDLIEVGGLELGIFELSLGFLVSFLSGFLAIGFLLKFLKTHSLTVFVIYRIAMAIVLIILSRFGILS